jgi:hypothetical protein
LAQEAYDEQGIIQEAIRVIKQAVPHLLVITDASRRHWQNARTLPTPRWRQHARQGPDR